jgi:hypothetical protein
MSTPIWKFHVTVPTGTFGDVELALRNSGFGGEEAARLDDAIFDTTELSFSVRKDSPIDPQALQVNLEATGLIVVWVNKPAA